LTQALDGFSVAPLPIVERQAKAKDSCAMKWPENDYKWVEFTAFPEVVEHIDAQ
jgi:hypothetical protein